MAKAEGETKSRQEFWEDVFAGLGEKELDNDLELVKQDLIKLRKEIEEAELQKRVIEAELEKRKGQVEK